MSYRGLWDHAVILCLPDLPMQALFHHSGAVTCNLQPVGFGNATISSFGLFTQSTDDETDWQLGESTRSSGTGPPADHTSGAGFFAFLEASGPTLGDRVCSTKLEFYFIHNCQLMTNEQLTVAS